jgi:isocitrate/isopropylmalate dehydrogenase
VVVTTNMFGDIVTDLASVLQGGMGMAVGANVGRDHGMFEPIHGSAPKHAGKDKVNPIAMILAVKEGLEWLGDRKQDPRLGQAADAIEAAVVELLKTGAPLTYDLVGEARPRSAPRSASGSPRLKSAASSEEPPAPRGLRYVSVRPDAWLVVCSFAMGISRPRM